MEGMPADQLSRSTYIDGGIAVRCCKAIALRIHRQHFEFKRSCFDRESWTLLDLQLCDRDRSLMHNRAGCAYAGTRARDRQKFEGNSSN